MRCGGLWIEVRLDVEKATLYLERTRLAYKGKMRKDKTTSSARITKEDGND